MQKITIDAGFTCPNRDGSKGLNGCTFCNPLAFSPSYCREVGGIRAQIEAGKAFFARKHRGEVDYLAYFQSYSGTYASVDILRQRYQEALSVEGVKGIIIGTRPDCIDTAVLDLLCEIRQTHYVMVEYGVESCYDKTLLRINRGHDFACSRQAILATAERGIPVGVHLIIGLPGESQEEILQQADILSSLPISHLKLHQLQIMKGTKMAEEWQKHPDAFTHFSAEEYARLVAAFVRRLRPSIVLDRFAAASPSHLLLSPRWGLKPQEVQRMIEELLKESDK